MARMLWGPGVLVPSGVYESKGRPWGLREVRVQLGPQGSKCEGWCCPLVVEHTYFMHLGFRDRDHLKDKY